MKVLEPREFLQGLRLAMETEEHRGIMEMVESIPAMMAWFAGFRVDARRYT